MADRENTKSLVDSMKNLWNFVTTENPQRKLAVKEGPGVYSSIVDPKVNARVVARSFVNNVSAMPIEPVCIIPITSLQ